MKTITYLATAAILSLLSVALLTQAQDNRPSGTVVSWGQQILPYVEPGTRFTAISAGANHTVALTSNGSVVAWGNNGSGQTTVPVAAKSGVLAIAAGRGQTVALKGDGSVVAWGDNTFGQTTVPVAAHSGVVAIAAGASHTLALKTNGSVLAWGYNCCGQTTVPVAAQSGVMAIAAGSDYSVALKSDGSIVAWGDNRSGQRTVPVGLPPALAIAAGHSFTVALVRDPPPSLTILRNADQTVTLSWRGVGTLEQSVSLDALNWETSPNQSNPQTIITNGGRMFYRLRH